MRPRGHQRLPRGRLPPPLRRAAAPPRSSTRPNRLHPVQQSARAREGHPRRPRRGDPVAGTQRLALDSRFRGNERRDVPEDYLRDLFGAPRASRIACHTRSGVTGGSLCSPPRPASAAMTAVVNTARPRAVSASPPPPAPPALAPL